MKEHLPDGEYWATCKERNALAAALNGHGAVFPQARMTVKNGTATFHRNGVELWVCNSIYAAVHFQVEKHA